MYEELESTGRKGCFLWKYHSATEKDVEPERRIVITNEELKFNEAIGVQLKSIFNTTLSGGDCNQIREQLRPMKDSYKRQVKTELMSEVNTLVEAAGRNFDQHFEKLCYI